MELSVGIKLLISLALGAAIGLEREVHEKYDPDDEQELGFLGVRSFSLITALGAVAGLLFDQYFSLSLLISTSFMSLLMIHYIFSSYFTKDIGITTELAVIFSFLLGMFIALEIMPMQLIVAITVVLIVILSNKDKISSFTKDINRRQLRAFVGYAIIALVILPFLPDTSITLNKLPFISDLFSLFKVKLGNWESIELINPFKLWLIVALITGVDLAGYLLEKTVGQRKGWLLASLVGGIVSSTATTQSIAQQSKANKQTNRLVGAAILATTISFIPTFLIIAPINGNFAARSLPTIALLFFTSLLIGFGFIFRKSKKKNTADDIKLKKSQQIFSLRPALIFAVIYLLVKIITSVALQLFGTSGFLIGSAIAGLTGIDTVSINIADKAGEQINYHTAVLAFILVNAVNLSAKTFYSYLQGSKEFVLKYGVSMSAVIAASLLGLIFI